MDKLPVILTYSWVRSTYSVMRCLAKKGIRVYSADSSNIGMCQFSRLKKKHFKYNNPFEINPIKFIYDINNIANRIGKCILLPSHDETEILAKYKEHLSNNIILPIADYQKIKMANNKYDIIEFAKKVGLNVPQIYTYNDLKVLENCDNEILNKQYVVKMRKGNSAKGVFYPKSLKDAIFLIHELTIKYSLDNNNLPILQERIYGEGWGVSCLYWEGEKIAHFTHRRLREKIVTGGTSTLRESNVNPILEKMAFDILDELKWHGLAMVEFKYDSINKKAWFIEINPRIWGSINLAITAGVEFPYLLYLCVMGKVDQAKEIFYNTKIKKPWVARWYLGDLIYILDPKNRNNNMKGITKILLPGGSNVYDDIYLDDPFVFVGEIANYLYKFIKYKSVNPIEEGTFRKN